MELIGIAVDSPIGKLRTYTYSNNKTMPMVPGDLVWVPFGKNTLQGIVVKNETDSSLHRIKPAIKTVGINYRLSNKQLELGIWISRHYQTSLFTALALFLPPGAKRKISYSYNINVKESLPIPESLAEISNKLSGIKTIQERELKKMIGPKSDNFIQQLLNQKIITKIERYPSVLKVKYSQAIVLSQSYAKQSAEEHPGYEAARELLNNSPRLPVAQVKKTIGVKAYNNLLSKGIIGVSWTRQNQITPRTYNTPPEGPTLNKHQKIAVDTILSSINSTQANDKRYLLHGIPSSGKTEVYMTVIDQILKQGRNVIFLVPEISLATQTLQELDKRFPGKVCTLHSNLTVRQKFEIWTDIQEGKYNIVVGPRSALFSPVERLGMIVIDEEHEWNYKQQDIEPFYHARTLALQICLKHNATLLLGSATPSVETFFNASERGFYKLLNLPNKAISSMDDTSKTTIEVVDMREELLDGNSSIFSEKLLEELRHCIDNDKQAILFLNRRGTASIVSCRECGAKVSCPSCSTIMTYHQDYNSLVCHTCNKKRKFTEICRICKGNQVRTLGSGTKGVVDELQELFPKANIGRWDGDVSNSFKDNLNIYNDFKDGKTQILVGTQMIAKGLNVSNVRLVGAIHADVGINLPDFRASEQWFTTLYQFIGRTGRDGSQATAVIQTFQPDHPTISLLSRYDYLTMYNQEISNRKRFNNPPYSRIAHMVFTHVNNTNCQKHASETAKLLRDIIEESDLKDIEIIGPAPGLPKKTRGKYRWHILVRGSNIHRVLNQHSHKSTCTIDVDPIHVL